MIIAEPFGKRFGDAQMVEDARLFIELHQGTVQVKPYIDSLFQRVAALGELRQGRQRLLKVRYGFAVR